MALNLTQRRLEPEWMDQPGLRPDLHVQALRGLARINWLCRSARILWPPIRQLALERPSRSLRVLDLGSGAGDVTIELWRLARGAGIRLEAVGYDISELAVEQSRRRAQQLGAAVDFQQRSAFELEGVPEFDAVICSLFLHHQDAERAIELLKQMARRAASLVLVNDLLRGPAGYALAWLGTRLITRSPVVHVDGPRSVAAAFTLREVCALAEQAGLRGARVLRRWPCRYLLVWRKPA